MKELYIKEDVLIPFSELEISSSRSGGPGGQHVNKTNSKVIIRWNVNSSVALTDSQKILILEKLKSRLTSQGDLLISNNESRSQIKNRNNAIEQFKKIIKNALYVSKKRKKTKIPKNIKENILKKKKEHSKIKELRKKVSYN